MTLATTPAAIARASDADYSRRHPRMRAHLYIGHNGIHYRSRT